MIKLELVSVAVWKRGRNDAIPFLEGGPMSLNKAKWLLAGLRRLIVWPGATHAQSLGLKAAFNRYSELHAQGRYREASVRTNGKIDDKKAAKAGMINPKWIEEQPAWVLKKLGIKGK